MAVKVLMVCHAGAGTGLGHLTRSLVAARALEEEAGFDVCFLIQGDVVDRADLKRFRHRFIPFECRLSDSILQMALHEGIEVVVFDLQSSQVSSDIEGLLVDLKRLGCKLVSIDALSSLHQGLDMIYVPSFCFTPPDGADRKKFFFGWDCFLLNASGTPSIWRPGSSVLVLTGGSDATGLGNTLPELFDSILPTGVDLHWVVGPYAANPRLPDSQKRKVIAHAGLSNLDALAGQVNYAVTVYGVSFFELLYYGIPTVVFSPYGLKDDAELALIASAGVALVAKDEYDAVRRLKILMGNDDLASDLSLRAKQKLSSGGPHKFAQALQRWIL